MKTTVLLSLLQYYTLLALFIIHLDALVIKPAPLTIAYVTQQGALNLSCTCQDCTPGPCAQIAWYRDNVPIDPSSGGTLQVINNTSSCTSALVFASVQAKQSGWYTCAAANALERTEKDFLVIASSPPVLVFNLSYFVIYTSLNTSIPLPCPVSGIPAPSITWYENVTSSGAGGTPVSSDFINSVTGSLKIPTAAMVGSTSGETFVKCIAANGYGEQSITVAVRFNNSLPMESAINTSYNYLPSELTCLTNSSSNASFFWLYNGVPISVYNQTYRPSTGGYYCCGVNVSETVTMYCTIITQSNSTLFLVAPAPYTSVMAGRTINLVCTINATNPPIYYDVPTLSWLSGGKALVNTSTVTALNSKAFSYLSILDAQPNNRLVYSCSNGARTVTTNVTVLSGCGLPNAVGSPSAEESQSDIRKHWSFSRSYTANVNGENCFVATYNESSGQYPSIEQEISGPARSTKMCISARIRQVGSPMATPMVCLMAVETNNAQRTVACLAHPFPSSPAWYWVQREISLPEEGIKTTNVKLKIVLTVDNPSLANGIAYFDDITASFSSTQPQLFISFLGSLGVAMVLVSCCVACQLCCRRKSGINARTMKKLTMELSKYTLQRLPLQENSAVPYMTRLVQDCGKDKKPFVEEMQQTNSNANKHHENQTEEYDYVDNRDTVPVFVDENSTVFVISARSSQQDKQPNPTASTGTAPTGDRGLPASVDQHGNSANNATSLQGTSSVIVPEVSVKQLIAAINQPASMDGNSANDTTSLPRTSSVNVVPEVSVKQLIATINQTTTSSGDSNVPEKNLVPKATDSSVKTEKAARDLTAYLLPAEEYEAVDLPEPATSNHQSATDVKSNKPKFLSTTVLPPAEEYEAVDLPEPATSNRQSATDVKSNKPKFLSTTVLPPAEEYEAVDLPEPATSNRQSATDVKSLHPTDPQHTDIYEAFEISEPAVNPNKRPTSVSGYPATKDYTYLNSAALPQIEEYDDVDIITNRHTSVSRYPATKDRMSLSPAALSPTEDYEIADITANSKGQAPTRNNTDPLPTEPRESNYMALTTSPANSTYDSVTINNTASDSNYESEYYI